MELLEPRFLLAERLLELRDLAVLKLRRPFEVVLALGALELAPGRVALRLGGERSGGLMATGRFAENPLPARIQSEPKST